MIVFVMYEWGKSKGESHKIRMLGDPDAKLAKALGIDKFAPGALQRTIYRRFASVVEDGVLKQFNVEAEGASGLVCSASHHLKL